MIDHITSITSLSREDAYLLCSLCVDLKISEVVDAGEWIVSALLPEAVFTRRVIVAMGGAQLRPEDYDPRLNAFVLSLARRERPRVCFVGTASGDSPDVRRELLPRRSRPTTTASRRTSALFERTVADLRSFVLAQDVIWVGGGNTASLLAVWRMHGLDAVLREAWEAGVVLCGVSAGMNCWFEASTTDSFDLSRARAAARRARPPAGQRVPALRRRGAAAAAVPAADRRGGLPARATPPTTRRRWCSTGPSCARWSRRPRARPRTAWTPTASSALPARLL